MYRTIGKEDAHDEQVLRRPFGLNLWVGTFCVNFIVLSSLISEQFLAFAKRPPGTAELSCSIEVKALVILSKESHEWLIILSSIHIWVIKTNNLKKLFVNKKISSQNRNEENS